MPPYRRPRRPLSHRGADRASPADLRPADLSQSDGKHRPPPSLPARRGGFCDRERSGVLQPLALRGRHGLPRRRRRQARVRALSARPGRQSSPGRSIQPPEPNGCTRRPGSSPATAPGSCSTRSTTRCSATGRCCGLRRWPTTRRRDSSSAPRRRAIAPGFELVWAYGGVNGQRGAARRRHRHRAGADQPVFPASARILPGQRHRDRKRRFHAQGQGGDDRRPGARRRQPGPRRFPALDRSRPPCWPPPPAPAPELPVLVGRAPARRRTAAALLRSSASPSARRRRRAQHLPGGTPRSGRAAAAQRRRSRWRPPTPGADLPRHFAETEAHFTALRTPRRRRHARSLPQRRGRRAQRGGGRPLGRAPAGASCTGRSPGARGSSAGGGPMSWTSSAGTTGRGSTPSTGPDARTPIRSPPRSRRRTRTSNLARNEAGLHSNGDISNSHYDMNLVFIDALFRHLLWTGDRGVRAAGCGP